MSQPFVLAIEPDLRQAAIVKRIVRDKALAEIAVVDSRDAAIEAMRTSMPDVLLLSALLSPRDEDELMAHLRTLENAGHLQTHTIPQLASALGQDEGRSGRGLLSAFRRKKEPERVAAGCDPDLFAEEIRVFLQRAADRKKQLLNSDHAAPDMRPGATESSRPAVAPAEPQGSTPSSSWSSPFEWKPSGGKTSAAQPVTHAAPVAEPTAAPVAEPVVAPIAEPVLEPVAEPVAEEPSLVVSAPAIEESTAHSASVVAEPVAAAAPSVEPAFEPAVAEPEHVEPQLVAEAVTPVPVARQPITIDTEASIPSFEVVGEPTADHELVEAHGAAPQEIEIALDSPDAETPVIESVAERAAKIARAAAQPAVSDEWTDDRRARAAERLGPLARWARVESPGKSKAAPVTADDVRALMASLSVPTGVAWVSYPRGVRIRRVRVPPAAGTEPTDSVGAVILSRRALAEQREKRPGA